MFVARGYYDVILCQFPRYDVTVNGQLKTENKVKRTDEKEKRKSRLCFLASFLVVVGRWRRRRCS